uniref:AidA/PixA family protein n=1 Tax=Photorhabdus sp. RM322S TaxID=3342825 RepID=UPI0036D7E731
MSQSTVDILVAIDVESILSDHKNLSKDPENPTKIDGKYFYYITTQHQTYSPSYNASEKLQIKGRVGDIVRWRTTSLTAQFDYQVFLYQMHTKNQSFISTPSFKPEISDVAAPSKNSSSIDNEIYPIESSEIQNSYHEATLVASGEVEYTWYISIYNRWEGLGEPDEGLLGYCTYISDDAVINIHN